jgi:putative membrane protein
MKRLTLDLVLASVLAAAPLAWAQQDLEVPGAIKNRNDTLSAPRPTPSTMQRNTPPFPGDEPLPPQRVPPDVPAAGTPTPSTTGTEPIDAHPPAGVRPEAADGDVRLVQKIHQLNEQELKIAQLAADKARSPRVKSYARLLVSQHKAAERQLMSYVNRRGLLTRLQQTATTGTTGTAGADRHARLLGETGAEFDHDFVATMVDDHDQAIEQLRTARDSAVDPQLRDLFHGLLPKLEKHRKMAQQLLDKHLKS